MIVSRLLPTYGGLTFDSPGVWDVFFKRKRSVPGEVGGCPKRFRSGSRVGDAPYLLTVLMVVALRRVAATRPWFAGRVAATRPLVYLRHWKYNYTII